MSAAAPSRLEEIVELVKKLCLAEMAVASYSAEHPFGKKSVSEAFDCLDRMLKQRNEPIALSSSGRTILCEGHPLEEKNQMVARLAKSLEDIHVTNLFFRPGLAAEDFDRFFGLLAKGARHINEHGGLQQLMKEAQVRNIELKDVSYVMVTDEQKVVSRDARVVDGPGGGGDEAGGGGNAEIVRYMIGRVMKEAKERKWLITEVKNNPQKVAELITEGIELAASRQELGLAGGSELTIEGIVQNIRAVGQSLAGSAADGGEQVADQDLESAVIEMEREIRERSATLTSSTVARGFINEILSVITTFSDQIKARQISSEFLKGETNLRKTEEILKSLAPQSESAEQFLHRIQSLLRERGVKEEQLGELLDIATRQQASPSSGIPQPSPAARAPPADAEVPPAAREPRKRRRPRKPAAERDLGEDIIKEIKSLGFSGDKAAAATQELGTFIEKKARDRARVYREERDRLVAAVNRRDQLLAALPVAVILWDAEGTVEFASKVVADHTGIQAGYRLTSKMLEFINGTEFPLASAPGDTSNATAWGEHAVELLSGIFKVLRDADYLAIGAVINPGKVKRDG